MRRLRRGTLLLPLVLCCTLTAAGADPFQAALDDAGAGRYGAAAAGFFPLAQAGDGEAAYNLAVLYATGRGVPQNSTEAAFWALKAELTGLTGAGGLRRKLMDGLPQDTGDSIAARMEAELTPAARAGDGAAMLALAAILASVRSEPDPAAAHAWQSIAAALDVPGAVPARDASLTMIPAAERPAAQDQARLAFIDWCADRGDAAPPNCAVVTAAQGAPGS
nr:SEL1-like repeat protein [Paracoccus saliphilus]